MSRVTSLWTTSQQQRLNKSRPNNKKKKKKKKRNGYTICPGGSVSFDRAVKSHRENCHLGLPNETSPVFMTASRRTFPSWMGEGWAKCSDSNRTRMQTAASRNRFRLSKTLLYSPENLLVHAGCKGCKRYKFRCCCFERKQVKDIFRHKICNKWLSVWNYLIYIKRYIASVHMPANNPALY